MDSENSLIDSLLFKLKKRRGAYFVSFVGHYLR